MMAQNVIDLTFDERANDLLSRINRAERLLRAQTTSSQEEPSLGPRHSHFENAKRDVHSHNGDIPFNTSNGFQGDHPPPEAQAGSQGPNMTSIDPKVKAMISRTARGADVQAKTSVKNGGEGFVNSRREVNARPRPRSMSAVKPSSSNATPRPSFKKYSSTSPFPHSRVPQFPIGKVSHRIGLAKPTDLALLEYSQPLQSKVARPGTDEALKAPDVHPPVRSSFNTNKIKTEVIHDSLLLPQPQIYVDPQGLDRISPAPEALKPNPTIERECQVLPGSDEPMIAQTPNTDTFPPNFDRGRFPKERRRRGGLKNGLRRLPGSTVKSFEASKRERAARGELADARLTDCSDVSPRPSSDFNMPFEHNEIGLGNERKRTSMWTAKDESDTVAYFLPVIAPVLDMRHSKFAKTFSSASLATLVNELADKTISDELLHHLRRINFQTTGRQRKCIRKRLRHIYDSTLASAVRSQHDLERRTPMMELQIPWTELFSGNNTASEHRSEIAIGGTVFNEPSGQDLACDKKSPLCYLDQNVEAPSESLQAAVTTFEHWEPVDSSSTRPAVQPQEHKTTKRKRVIRASKLEALRSIQAFNPYCQDTEEEQQETSKSEPICVTPRRAAQSKAPLTAFMKHKQAAAALRDVNGVDIARDHVSQAMISTSEQKELLHSESLVRGIISREDGGHALRIVETSIVDPVQPSAATLPAMLRRRELGPGAKKVHRTGLHSKLLEMPRPWRRWKGASSDIVSVAWAPDCTTFAVGAAAHTNTEDLQYNRPCNLMLGDLIGNKLIELPEHRTCRPRPNAIAAGPNSIQEVYNTCDPLVYQTVNSLAFGMDGRRLYTASRDHTLKAWEACDYRSASVFTIDHGEVVTNIDVCKTNSNRLATACQSIDSPIRVISDLGDSASIAHQFHSSRAWSRPSMKIYPECIRWGSSIVPQYLLAGFTQWESLGQDELARQGHLCLWDLEHGIELKVSPNAQSVSSLAWHPTLCGFVTGGAPSQSHQRRSQSIKSCVRTYDCRQATSLVCEFDSVALEIQDVTFNPQDSRIVTAGCTDGTIYVWDCRQPNDPIHTLEHGQPLLELDASRPRGECDTGVRLNLWGNGASLFYSGSSDGVVKAWDFRRHPDDVLKYNVAHLGVAIQDGAFSPDFTHLLVGDADGGFHVLSSAPCGPQMMEEQDHENIIGQDIELIRAPNGSGETLTHDNTVDESVGIQMANRLVESGEIQMHPLFGPGKGVNYKGPYASQRSEILSRSSGQQVFDVKRGIFNDDAVAHRRAFHAMRRSLLDLDSDDTCTSYNPAATGCPYDTQTRQHFDVSPGAHSPKGQISNTYGLQPLDGNPVSSWRSSNTGHPHGYHYPDLAEPKCLADESDSGISEAEMVEENHWWPKLGKDEIQKAINKK